MEGADGRDEILEWEALYLQLPQTWNESNWNGSSWNSTTAPNATWWGEAFAPFDSPSEIMQAAVKAVVLGLLILATVIGNVFVIAAILLERHLRSAANQLILSLAVADLLVYAHQTS